MNKSVNHINLIIRFFIELVALFTMGFWGWNQADGGWKYALAIALPLSAASIWGIFAVPDDPSRSGKAPVPVPGILRLVIELSFFAFSAWSLFDLGYQIVGLILGIVILIHYLISGERVQWLIRQ